MESQKATTLSAKKKMYIKSNDKVDIAKG